MGMAYRLEKSKSLKPAFFFDRQQKSVNVQKSVGELALMLILHVLVLFTVNRQHTL